MDEFGNRVTVGDEGFGGAELATIGNRPDHQFSLKLRDRF